MERVITQHAIDFPDAIAVVDSSRSKTLTYNELLTTSRQLSHSLISNHISRNEPVGILVTPGVNQIVAQIAVRMAGATCVPLDPSLPPKRIQAMLLDVEVRLFISDETTIIPAGLEMIQRVLVPDMQLNGTNQNGSLHSMTLERPEDSNCSHILFTSGSTGTPKPVQISERGILHIASHAPMTPLAKTDRVAHFNNVGFDLSIFEIWVTLLSGATIVVIPRSIVSDPGALPSFLRENQVTVSIIPTALFNITAKVSPSAFRCLRHALVAGEAASPHAMRAVLESNGAPAHLWNAYGPTEGTVFATTLEITLDEAMCSRIGLGRAFGQNEVFLLDEQMAPIWETGVEGELCMAGPGVSLGYVGREAENRERFIFLKRSTLTPGSGSEGVVRLYRTGDLAKWRSKNSRDLDFLGRRDSQVKVQGFRVELGEIEKVLEASPEVSAAVVYQSEMALVACVKLTKSGTRSHLEKFAREHLPRYMLPTSIEAVSSFPLTPNGKIDRQSLRERSRRQHSVDGASPIISIWQNVLGRSGVTEGDDFFDPGGPSIQAAALIASLREQTGKLISMDALFSHSRLSDLAHLIEITDAHDNSGFVNDYSEIMTRDIAFADDLKLVPDWESEGQGKVFITGVTGFRPGVKRVACLARRRGSESAAARVQKAMERYDLYPSSLELLSKIKILEGDIIDEDLAKVNFNDTYQQHYWHNAIGTKNSFHYFSSLDVWGPTGYLLGTKYVADDEPLLPHLKAQQYDIGYAQSQWVVEAMVRRAQERGLPASIYRPGFILGHSQTGAGNPDDFISRWLVGCIQLGKFPRVSDLRFEYSTIDFVCKATLQIASSSENLGRCYHILSNDQSKSVTQDQTCDLLNEAGFEVQMIEYKEWLGEVQRSNQSGLGEALRPLLPVLQEPVLNGLTRWEISQSSPRFDASNMERALEGSGIEFIPITSDILRRILGFWQRNGYYKVYNESGNGYS
ncbi:hypothetical protein BJY04DRAFT_232080 [Aspergillus karnatakaensis]|uniref:uncharacterized protein n=1 Tax=Aspergillus karnatakaensis TaxID=1810916 RepID=UPI003CCC9434